MVTCTWLITVKVLHGKKYSRIDRVNFEERSLQKISRDMVKKSTLEYFVSYVVWWVLHQISKSNVWSRCVFRAKSNISDGDFLQKIVDSFMAWTISAKKLFCRCLAGILIRFWDGTSRPEIFKKVLGTQIYKIRIERFFL